MKEIEEIKEQIEALEIEVNRLREVKDEYEKKLLELMGIEFFDFANLVEINAFKHQFPKRTIYYVE